MVSLCFCFCWAAHYFPLHFLPFNWGKRAGPVRRTLCKPTLHSFKAGFSGTNSAGFGMADFMGSAWLGVFKPGSLGPQFLLDLVEYFPFFDSGHFLRYGFFFFGQPGTSSFVRTFIYLFIMGHNTRLLSFLKWDD